MLVVPVGAASAQTPGTRPEPRRSILRVAADEDSLWIARVDPDQTQFYRRGVTGQIEPITPLNAAVSRLAVSCERLYVFTEDGDFYAWSGQAWQRELDLPGRQQPLDLVADACAVYALIPSSSAGELAAAADEGAPAQTRPFEVGRATVAIVRYDPGAWVGFAAGPPGLATEGPRAPTLMSVQGKVYLLARGVGSEQIECLRYDAPAERWEPAARIAPLPDLLKFWGVGLARAPAIIVSTRGDDGGEELSVLRLLGTDVGERRPVALRLSARPPGAGNGRCDWAGGFNQHAVLLMTDPVLPPYLLFGQVDTPPAEETIAIVSLLTRQEAPERRFRWLQAVMLFVLFAVLVALFVFRRGAMIATVSLPPGCTQALTLQRLLGFAVDFVPAALIIAFALGVDAQAGLRELFGWAAGSDGASGKFPAARSLMWWGASCAFHTVYCLVMELLTQRTIGKVLLGTRVLSEAAVPATPVQIVVRNALRLLELMPPLWVLGFLVVLSRNRQRLGDIFARTLVVRRARPPTDDKPTG